MDQQQQRDASEERWQAANDDTKDYPTGRSDYNPRTVRVGQQTPQTAPEHFSREDIVAEVKHLLSLNKRHGSHPLRTAAYRKLLAHLEAREA